MYLSFLRVHNQHLAWLQTAFFQYLVRLETYDSGFARHDHHSCFRDQISGRAQSVPVQHPACIASVSEQQGGRSVPWLHQYRMVFVEGFQVFADRVFVIERLRYKHCHGMRKAHAGHHEEFQNIVQGCTVAHSGLDYRADGLYVRDFRCGEDAFPCFHPGPVSSDGVDFSIVRQHPERLGETPCRERVRAESGVHEGDSAGEIRLREVREVFPDLRG